VAVTDVVGLIGDEGTGAHQRHVTFDHIEQVGQLVEGPAADHPAHPGDARVVGETKGGVTVDCQFDVTTVDPLVGVFVHGTKLEHPEDALVAAHPVLTKHNRPAVFDEDGHRHCRHHR
jgi:hypothetical protein